MDKVLCVALLSCGSCAVVCLPVPKDFERKDQQECSMVLAMRSLRVSLVGGATGHGRTQEAGLSPSWQNSPASLPTCCSPPEAENRAGFLCLVPGLGPWQVGLGFGASVSSPILSEHFCCPPHMGREANSDAG